MPDGSKVRCSMGGCVDEQGHLVSYDSQNDRWFRVHSNY